jgi:hypothetical protein
LPRLISGFLANALYFSMDNIGKLMISGTV